MLDDLDNLRERSAASPFDEEVSTLEDESKSLQRGSGRPFLGMTAAQRFVLALMLLLNVAVLGCLCTLATGNVTFDAFYNLIGRIFGLSF